MAKKATKAQEKNVKLDSKKSKHSEKEEIKEKKNIKIKEEKKDLPVKEIVKKEKVKKVKKGKDSNRKEKANAFFQKVDDNRNVIIVFVVGFLLATLLFRCILWPDRIATLSDGTQPIVKLTDKTITADDLYTSMKEFYSVNTLLNDIDDIILSKMYPQDDEMKNEVQDTADYYYNVYESSYGYTKETFLSQYGFASESDFIDSLTLDYRRNKYSDEYAESLVSDKDIDKYYENEVFGDVDSKHILVAIDSSSDDGLTDEEAKKLANEIIEKLNKGTSWDDVVKEYGDKITHEELGYNAFNASLEDAYLKECKDLKVDTYSKTPVLTSYGYHIVYKIAQKDKPELDDVKDDIVEILAKDKKDDDENFYYKALIKMRDEAALEFVDTKLSEEYKKYINKYN